MSITQFIYLVMLVTLRELSVVSHPDSSFNIIIVTVTNTGLCYFT